MVGGELQEKVEKKPQWDRWHIGWLIKMHNPVEEWFDTMLSALEFALEQAPEVSSPLV
jgi:hypothetical protein